MGFAGCRRGGCEKVSVGVELSLGAASWPS